jgi:hypothetical protein
MSDRLHPALADVLDRGPHANRIDFRRGGDGADHHRHVVFAAGRINDIGEQERAALGFRNPTDKLQAHQGVQLGVLVDRMVDPGHEAPRLEVGEMLLQIEPRLAVRGALPAAGNNIIHISRLPARRRVGPFATILARSLRRVSSPDRCP